MTKSTPRTPACAAASAALALVLSAASAFAADDKPKVAVGATGKIADGVTATAQLQTWFLDGDVVSQENFVYLSWKANSWLSLGLVETLAHARKAKTIYTANKDGTYKEANDTYWVFESRPGFDATLSFDLGGWKFSDRNRVEFREFDDRSENHWRYRNLFKVVAPWSFTELKIRPYASLELFVAGQAAYSGWEKANQVREQVGLTAALSDRLGATLYLQGKHMKRASDGDWYLNDREWGVGLTAKF